MTITLTKGATVRVVPTGQGPVPAALVGNQGAFSQTSTPQSSVTVRGAVTFNFAGSHITGKFACGNAWVWNPPHQDGLSVTSISPAATTVSTTWVVDSSTYSRKINGTELNSGANALPANDIAGFDDFKRNDVGGSTFYDNALNVDPGNTGNPIVFARGAEGTLSKSIYRVTPENDARQVLDAVHTLHIVRQLPTVGDIAPSQPQARKRARWSEANVDWDKLPAWSSTGITGFSGYNSTMERRNTWTKPAAQTKRPNADRWTSRLVEEHYAADGARDWFTGFLYNLFDIPFAERRVLTLGMIQFGQEIWGTIQRGGHYYTSGLGQKGVGYIMPLAFAAWMMNDQEIIDWLAVTRNGPNNETLKLGPPACVFQETIQYRNVTQADRDASNGDTIIYYDEDVGAPEWWENPTRPASEVLRRRHWGRNYRNTERRWSCASSLALNLLPGLRTVYNPAEGMLDYHDRIYERWFYKTGTGMEEDPESDNRNLLKWGFNPLQSGTPPAFHRSCWEVLRSTGDRPIWDWPA
jgi:hypothetical protein